MQSENQKNKEKMKKHCEIVINFTMLFLRLLQKVHEIKAKKKKIKETRR